jgi:hypothetical protein
MPKKPDLMQWKRSEHLARRVVRRYIKLVNEADAPLLEEGAPEVESLIALIALAISKTRIEAPARRAVRSAAASASRRAAKASATTRARAPANSRPPTTKRRTRVRPR